MSKYNSEIMALATTLLILTVLMLLTNNIITKSDAQREVKPITPPKGITNHPLTQSPKTPELTQSPKTPELTQSPKTPELTQSPKTPELTQSPKTPELTKPLKGFIIPPNSKLHFTVSKDISEFNTRNIQPLMDFVGLSLKYSLGLMSMIV